MKITVSSPNNANRTNTPPIKTVTDKALRDTPPTHTLASLYPLYRDRILSENSLRLPPGAFLPPSTIATSSQLSVRSPLNVSVVSAVPGDVDVPRTPIFPVLHRYILLVRLQIALSNGVTALHFSLLARCPVKTLAIALLLRAIKIPRGPLLNVPV